MSRRTALLNSLRNMLKPQTINLIRIEGITRRNGLVVTDRELERLQQKHTVRIISIVPASEFFNEKGQAFT